MFVFCLLAYCLFSLSTFLFEAGEVAFYLRETREQFRVKGRLQVISASETNENFIEARNHQWKQISPASRASFATSHIPGFEISVEDESGPALTTGKQSGEVEEIDFIHEAVEDFCLVLLWPSRVDHLELKGGQRRHVHTLVEEHRTYSGQAAASAWRTIAVHP